MFRRPLTRLESAICVLIVAVLATVLLDRLMDHAELAERAYVEVTLLRIQEGINTRRALGLLKGQSPDVGAWLKGNPFALAGLAPSNFAGEFESPAWSELVAGNWLFDRGREELVYRPRLTRYLEIPGPEQLLKFRLAGAPGGMGGISPVPVKPYKWEIE